MSRDWTPKEVAYAIKLYDIPDLLDQNITIHMEGKEPQPMYSQEEIELCHRYAKLGRFGVNFLLCCMQKGVFNSELGKELVQKAEDSFSTDIDDKELKEKVELWYVGKLEPGYDLSDNNWALANYIVSRIRREENNE